MAKKWIVPLKIRHSRYALLILGLLLVQSLRAQTAPDFRKAAGAEWPLVGGDWGNTRYSTLAKINTSNVKTLKGAWMTRLNSGFGPPYSQQGTPVVKRRRDVHIPPASRTFSRWTRKPAASDLGISHANAIPKRRTTKPSAAWRWVRGWSSASRRISASRRPHRAAWSRSPACSPSIRKLESYCGSTNSAKTCRRTFASTSPPRPSITKAWCTSACRVETAACADD